MSFRHKPTVAPLSPEDFVNAAEHKTVDKSQYHTNTNISVVPDAAQSAPAHGMREVEPPQRNPWDGFNRKAASNKVFNLRLNEYWWAVLHHVGEQDEDKSLQKLVKEILLPELERRTQGDAD